MTITVSGTNYEVTKTERGYLLTGKRGASYGLLRNVNRPEMLFPVNLSTRTVGLPQNLKDIWFTDQSGLLALR